MFKEGASLVAFDEAFTLHPLVVMVLLRLAAEYGVATYSTGEALQITAKKDPRYLSMGWHEMQPFQQEEWQELEREGRLLYVRLGTNHRLPPDQFKMLMRVRHD
jgi:hypothetical protein